MLLYQTSITKILFLLSIICYTFNGFAQQKKVYPLVEHNNGIDHFPVFKAVQKNSFIDSIIYNGPFITFCISFEKPTSDGHYVFEAVNNKHGWACETPKGLSKPVLIKNIHKDGKLVSKLLKEKSVDLKFYDKEKEMVRISCEILFFRPDFVHGETILSENFNQRYSSEKMTWVEFNSIRIRTNSYPKPVEKEYIENFEWATNSLLEKMSYTINEVPQKITVSKLANNSIPSNYNIPTYNVRRNNQNQLFLKGVWHTSDATIFRVQYYVFDDYPDYSINLHNKGNQKYYIKIGSKKIKMHSIKNICLNQYLIKEALYNKESLKLKNASNIYLLTYDIYFDRLPNNLESFDLVEGIPKEGSTPFDFYSIKLN